jgi:hypothetical protein
MGRMSKKRKKTKSSTPGPGSRIARAAMGGPRRWLVLLILAVVSIGGTMGFAAMERHIQSRQRALGSTTYALSLETAPHWAPRSLLRTILKSALPAKPLTFEDARLCEDIHVRMQANPWVNEVRSVRRVRTGPRAGRVTIDATFHRPVARVNAGMRIAYVAFDGTVLPSHQAPAFVASVLGRRVFYQARDHVPAHARPLHYPLIDGVQSIPPQLGRTWNSPDLHDGLRLYAEIIKKPYANQITVYDVRNFGRRISDTEPELRMSAQAGLGRVTDIRFGRWAKPGDFVIPVARKMEYLDEYSRENKGWLAGRHLHIELRYDELRTSQQEWQRNPS